jgi:hypothetical protein
MLKNQAAPFYLALVHHPVLNRRGEIIASAITNLDLHDLARLSCTYGIAACYIVTPLGDQQALVESLLSHWCKDVAKDLHPDRGHALQRLRVVESVECARLDVARETGREPLIWATTARESEKSLPLRMARQSMEEEPEVPRLVLLGTGWGLAPKVLDEADAVLETIRGANGYNHLSVRCAAAILVDRLLQNEYDC